MILTYFCYVESDSHSVPHMEPLAALTHDEARDEALRLLKQHARARVAHVFKGDERIHSLAADERALG